MITNNDVKRFLYDFMQFRRCPPRSTKRLATRKHNSELCPAFQKTIERILGAFEKYRRIVYDVQGPHDRGVDVFVRQSMNDEKAFVCFQIKSQDDMRSKDLLKNLKSQYFDAKSAYVPLLDYYIVLCCDATKKKMREKITLVKTVFASATDVLVVDPDYAFTFLCLSSTQIDAFLRSKLGSDDVVYNKALKSVANLTPTEQAIIYYLMWLYLYDNKRTVTYDDIRHYPFISTIYEEVPGYDRDFFFEDETPVDEAHETDEVAEEDDEDDGEEEIWPTNEDMETRLNRDLEYLAGEFLESDGAGNFTLDFRGLYPLAVIMMDAQTRYEHEGNDLIRYMMNVFSGRGYESPGEDFESVMSGQA